MQNKLSNNNRRVATILFADIVGYTSLMQSNEEVALAHLQKFKDELEKQVPENGGEIIQYFGDGCLVVFENSIDGVRCAKQLQLVFTQGTKVGVRIGIHTGEVLFKEGNAYGDPVNLASRIESLGVPGAVFFSGAIASQLKEAPEFKIASLGNFDFKNVEQSMEVFALANKGFPVPKRDELTGKLKGSGLKKQPLSWPLVILGFLVLTLLAYFILPGKINISSTTHEKKIAVLIFENQTGDPNLDVVGKMASDWVAQGLMQIEGISMVTPSTVREKVALAGIGGAMNELAKRNGVQYIFAGNYYLDGEELIIKPQLLNTKTSEVEYFLPDYKSHKDQPLDAVRELTERIMGYWLNKSQIENRITVPPKYEAYNTFLKGLEYYEVDNTKLRAAMEKAIEIDPNYFEPHVFLSYSYYYDAPRKTAKADSILESIKTKGIQLTAYQEALMNAAAAELKSQTDEAYQQFVELFNKYPDDKFVRYNAGTFALFSNHLDKAIEIYSGTDFDRLDYSINMEKRNLLFLFDALNQKGQYEKILELCDKYLQDHPDYFYLLVSNIHLNNQAAVDSIFAELDTKLDENLRRPKAYYYNIIGREYIKLDNRETANQCFEKSLKFSANYDHVLNFDRIFALFHSHQYETGIMELKQKFKELQTTNDTINKGIALNFLVYFHAATKELKEVEKYQNQRNQFPFQHYFHLTDAFAAMQFGNKSKAVELLKEAYQVGVIFEDIAYGHNVDFLPLHGFSPFDEFVKPKL